MLQFYAEITQILRNLRNRYALLRRLRSVTHRYADGNLLMSMKHMTAMAEHYVITANDNFRRTKHGHPKFDNFQVNLEPPRIIGKKKAYRLDACLLLHISLYREHPELVISLGV